MAGTGIPGFASLCTSDSNQDNAVQPPLHLSSFQFLVRLVSFTPSPQKCGDVTRKEGPEDPSPPGVVACAPRLAFLSLAHKAGYLPILSISISFSLSGLKTF